VTDTPTKTDPKPAHRSGFGAAAREFVLIVVGALIVSSILRAFVGQMFIIPSESMENTLLVGDRVVVEKLTDVKRGDVVVFEDPGGWLGPTESGQKRGSIGRFFEIVGLLPDSSHGHLIKRLIGMPGDKVACCDSKGRLMVNGQPLDETSYLYPGDPPSAMEFQVTVPAGRVFVMGETPIEVKRGTVETWLIRNYFNSMPHAMHLHGFHFQVLERQTSPDSGRRMMRVR